MKAITALFLVIGIALGYYVFSGENTMTNNEMIQDEVKRSAAAPVRSVQPL